MKIPAFRLVFSLCFGRSDEKKFCLLQLLRYRGFVKQKSINCYKSFKSHFFIKKSFLFYFIKNPPVGAGGKTGTNHSHDIIPQKHIYYIMLGWFVQTLTGYFYTHF